MTHNVQTQLEELSLGIIGALKSGIRPASMQTSYSQIGLGDYCAFAASAINHLVNKGTIKLSEKRECSIYMANVFLRTFGQRIPTNELNEFADIVVNIGNIESNFGGILAAIRMAR